MSCGYTIELVGGRRKEGLGGGETWDGDEVFEGIRPIDSVWIMRCFARKITSNPFARVDLRLFDILRASICSYILHSCLTIFALDKLSGKFE